MRDSADRIAARRPHRNPRVARRTPTLQDIADLAERAWAGIPRRLAKHAEAVSIRVEDLPDADVCREMELDSPYDLLGLYQGVSLAEKSVADWPQAPDLVYLYRKPLLEQWAEDGGSLACLVREVLLHEIGHHFGFSDDDMERICAEARREARRG